MTDINPFLLCDGYKTSHVKQYPKGTEKVVCNFTPRSDKHSITKEGTIVNFGIQFIVHYIHRIFNMNFFEDERAVAEIKAAYSHYLGSEYDVSHIEALHNLGYLPIKIKALPEGKTVPIGVPVLTIENTLDEFYWLPNFLETLISNLLWKPMTSATIARAYKRVLTKWALETDHGGLPGVDFQAHDFSMRGMDSPLAAASSSAGHCLYFKGSDSLPVYEFVRDYYRIDNKWSFPPIFSVPATEHSVMSAGGKRDEVGTFRRLLETYPTGILSVVSDTWDLWKVLTEYLPTLKDDIMARDGKLVIRPDSGDPVDIICGVENDILIVDTSDEDTADDIMRNLEDHEGEIICFDGDYYEVKDVEDFIREYGWDGWCQSDFLDINEMAYGGRVGVLHPVENPNKHSNAEGKGVVELLWDVFGGTVNEQGYKVLDSHIGAIYGDSITLARAEEICKRLAAKGFASTNIVFGVGSYTYQYNTRDTYGFAMKATYCEISGTAHDIFKDPVTDSGLKKSLVGLPFVYTDPDGTYAVRDKVSKDEFNSQDNNLRTVYRDGKYYNTITYTTAQVEAEAELLKEFENDINYPATIA